MNSKELTKRKKELEEVIRTIKKELPRLPEGNLRISRKERNAQYFWCKAKGETHGEYIGVGKMDLVKDLAKKGYYEKVLREAEREVAGITRYLSCMSGRAPEEVFGTMSLQRRELVTPIILTDEMYARNWEAEAYEKNPFRTEECIYPTKKGDMVRSKSEAFIADMYYDYGIPYRYEAAVRLKNGKVKYPDFTVLHVAQRSIYYHEHLGLLDDGGYLEANVLKLRDYQSSGICTGKNLILTWETEYCPLDIAGIRKMAKELFL